MWSSSKQRNTSNRSTNEFINQQYKKMPKVKITTCLDHDLWYWGKEGQIYEVFDADEVAYETENGLPIFKTDAEIVDEIVESVKKKFDERSRLGIQKYNTTLMRSKEGKQAFINHLQEELMDAILYAEKLKTMI